MYNTSEPARASSALGQWVEKVYDNAFCHPNDEVSTATMNENFAPGFTAT